MAAIKETRHLGDLLFYEADHLYSREIITVASGQQLKTGDLLGRITESGQLTVWNPKGKDGSELLAGVLLEDCDAKTTEQQAVMVTRQAILSDAGINWATLTEHDRTVATKQLKALGILIRRGV